MFIHKMVWSSTNQSSGLFQLNFLPRGRPKLFDLPSVVVNQAWERTGGWLWMVKSKEQHKVANYLWDVFHNPELRIFLKVVTELLELQQCQFLNHFCDRNGSICSPFSLAVGTLKECCLFLLGSWLLRSKCR